MNDPVMLLPPSHNIRDFEFLFATFDHSSYSKFFKIIIYFIYDLLYYLRYFKQNFSFLSLEKKLNKTSGQTLQEKLKIPYIMGWRKYIFLDNRINPDICFKEATTTYYNILSESKQLGNIVKTE